MTKKKKDKVSSEDILDNTVDTTNEDILENDSEEIVVIEEVEEEVVEEAPVTQVQIKEETNIEVGDIVNINIDHPKFKGKDLTVIEITGALIFVRAEGTRYGFNKNSVTKAE